MSLGVNAEFSQLGFQVWRNVNAESGRNSVYHKIEANIVNVFIVSIMD